MVAASGGNTPFHPRSMLVSTITSASDLPVSLLAMSEAAFAVSGAFMALR